MNIQKAFKVNTVEEAIRVLSIYKDRVFIICGGTDLVIGIMEGKINKDIVLDISDIKELKFIKEDDEYIKIGAGTTISDIEKSLLIPENLAGLKKAASSIGSPQIRNRGTIGGNICNASVAADLMPPLLALDSFVCLESKDYERHVMLRNFIDDNNKAQIKDNEIVKYIKFKKPNKHCYLTFNKLGHRKSLSIARVSSSVLMIVKDEIIEQIKIVNGAVGNKVIIENDLEDILIGKSLNIELIEKACNKAKISTMIRLWSRPNAREKAYAVGGILKKSMMDCIDYFEGR